MNLISVLRRVSVPLLSIGGLICVLGSFLLLSYILSHYEAQREQHKYRIWNESGGPELCRAIGARCSAPIPGQSEIYVPDGSPYSEAIISDQLTRDISIAARTRLSAMLRIDRCFREEESKAKISCGYAPTPGSLPEEFWRRTSGIPEALAVWLIAVVVLLSVRAMLRESHVGWRRVALLLAPMLGVIFGFVTWGLVESDVGITIVATLLGICIGLVAPILSRCAVSWVRGGFPGYEPHELVASEEQYENAITLNWKTLGILVLAVLCVGGAAVVMVTATENTLLAAIQGAGFALFGWFMSYRNRKEKSR